MSRVELELKNRRCRNREPHAEHQWRGLNTRHAGYYCPGTPVAQVIDLMAALKAALAERGVTDTLGSSSQGPEPILTPESEARITAWEIAPCACGHTRSAHLDNIGDPTVCSQCSCFKFVGSSSQQENT